MEIKDEIVYIETTQYMHPSGFKIIKAYMDGRYLSKSSDAIALHLKGGEYRIDSDEYGNVRIYPWCNSDNRKRVFVTEEPKDVSTVIIREEVK